MHSFETLSFYRGESKDIPLDRPSLFLTRKDRKPRDTAISLHEAADKWFKDTFNVAYRSQAVFVTPSLTIARFYGKSPDHCIRVVPLGDYSYCWSSKYADFLHLVKDVPSVEEMVTRLSNADYRTTDLATAHQSGNELMLFCEAYIAIPVNLLTLKGEVTSDSPKIILSSG